MLPARSGGTPSVAHAHRACLGERVGLDVDALDGLEDRGVRGGRRAELLARLAVAGVHRGLGELVRVAEVAVERVAHARHVAPVAEAILAALRIAGVIAVVIAGLLDRLQAEPELLVVVRIPAAPIIGFSVVVLLDLVVVVLGLVLMLVLRLRLLLRRLLLLLRLLRLSRVLRTLDDSLQLVE